MSDTTTTTRSRPQRAAAETIQATPAAEAGDALCRGLG